MTNNNKIWQVSEFLNSITKLLLHKYINIQIQAEISSIVIPASGHMYLTLKDEVSQIKAVMFSWENSLLQFKPTVGDVVLIKAQPTIYKERGDLQVKIISMQPYGIGQLQREFEILKAKLQSQGFFDKKIKKILPKSCFSIALITSATSAAIADVIKVLKMRSKWIRIVIYPTQVQGVGAAENMVKQIQNANEREKEDLILLVRGGGGYEDLQEFNKENLAIAIRNSRMPIVTGIGHQIDITIADLVADIFAPTPSAAATLICQEKEQILQLFAKITTGLKQTLLINLQKRKNNNQQQFNILNRHNPLNNIYQKMQQIDYVTYKLQRSYRKKYLSSQHINHLNNRLQRLKPILLLQQKRKTTEQFLYISRSYVEATMIRTENTLTNLQKSLDDCHPKEKMTNKTNSQNRKIIELHRNMGLCLQRRQTLLKSYRNMLLSLNPINVLKRGFAIVTHKTGKPITTALNVRTNTPIVIKFYQSKLNAKTE
jgi:exodeoxyribonuclease VII large subunit